MIFKNVNNIYLFKKEENWKSKNKCVFKFFFFNSFWIRGKKFLIRLFLYCLIYDLLSIRKVVNFIIYW